MGDFYDGPRSDPGMNEIQILTRDRDEWKRRELACEEQCKALEKRVISLEGALADIGVLVGSSEGVRATPLALLTTLAAIEQTLSKVPK